MTQLSQEFAEALERVQGEMQTLGQEAGLASPELQRFVDQMRDSAEVAEFMRSQAAMVVDGFNKIALGMTASWLAAARALDETTRAEQDAAVALQDYTAIAEDGQEAFDRLGRLAVVSFAAAASQGGSLTEILSQMGPSLDRLSAAQGEFGFASSGTFDQLMRFRRFIADNAELAGSIDGVNQMMSGLSNMGLLTQDTFNDLTGVVMDTFNQIVAQGLSGNDALLLMQPTLQTIWKLQKDYGFVVDEATQKLVTQAVEAGIVGEAQESAMDRAAAAMLKVAGLLEEILQKIGAIPSALDQIPTDIEINVGFNVEDLNLPQYEDFGFGFGDIESAQTGGTVTQGGLIQVHEGEEILPRGEGGSVTIRVPVYLDGRQIAEATVPYIPGVVRRVVGVG